MIRCFMLVVLSSCLCFAEWTNGDISTIKSDVAGIEDDTETMRSFLSLSLYNPMAFTASMVSSEYYDNLNTSRGNGATWYDSWELTDSNARLYAIDEISLRNSLMRSAYGRDWDDTRSVTHFQDVFQEPYITDLGTEKNVVGEQFSGLSISDSKVSDTAIKSKVDYKATYLVNSFQSIAQSYLNYTYTGQPLFEIDLAPIGLFYERIKERLPGYVPPSIGQNVFQDKKISVTLVPTQGTLLYVIHQNVTRFRTLITYMMWGFLVFETFQMIMSYANK